MLSIATKKFTADLVREGSWGSRQLGKHASTMELFKGSGEGYYVIEWDIPSIDEVEHIGIWIDRATNELVDYDGVFSLPAEAIALLEEQGFKVGDDFR